MQNHTGTPQYGQAQSARSPSISGAVGGTEGSRGGLEGRFWGCFCCFQENCGPCRLPPGSHLLSPPALLREPRLLASIPGRFFLLVSAKLPLSEGWRASIIESKERKQIKKKKNKTKLHHTPHLCCCPPSVPPMAAGVRPPPVPPLPQTGSDHSIQAPAVPVWL